MANGERSLTERGALTTYASSGIGAATPQVLAEEGASVALAARQTDRLQDAADCIEAACSTAVTVLTDVFIRWDTMVETARGEVGMDVLVTNAVVMRSAPVARSDLKDLRQMLDVDLFGLSSRIRRLWSLRTSP